MVKQPCQYTNVYKYDGETHEFAVESRCDYKIATKVYRPLSLNVFEIIIIYDEMAVIDCALGKLLLVDHQCEYLKKRYETDNMLDIILSHYREIYDKYF